MKLIRQARKMVNQVDQYLAKLDREKLFRQDDCKHSIWHVYASTKERQCADCKILQHWEGDSWQIQHKRNSTI